MRQRFFNSLFQPRFLQRCTSYEYTPTSALYDIWSPNYVPMIIWYVCVCKIKIQRDIFKMMSYIFACKAWLWTVVHLCFHLFFLFLSDRFWLFVMKSARVSYIKHSCGLITDEMSVSVKAKPHFGIITRLAHTQRRHVNSLVMSLKMRLKSRLIHDSLTCF